MFGYFGKSAIVAPPPTSGPEKAASAPQGVSASVARAELVTQPEASAATEAPELTESQVIDQQLMQLRAAVAAKRMSKEAQIRAVQETQQKQAAYGRDTTQLRPEKAGYATEAEKLMGGQTGYSARPTPAPTVAGLAGLGALTQDVSHLTTEITRLTNVVKQMTKDVADGMIPRSELQKAVSDLQTKSAQAKKLTSELSGLVDNPLPRVLLLSGSLVAIYLVYKCCF